LVKLPNFGSAKFLLKVPEFRQLQTLLQQQLQLTALPQKSMLALPHLIAPTQQIVKELAPIAQQTQSFLAREKVGLNTFLDLPKFSVSKYLKLPPAWILRKASLGLFP
jgi:hypothetical protein